MGNKKNRTKKGQLQIQAGKNFKKFLVPESSKAQLQIQEMAFFLVGVLLFFILVGLFALSIFSSNISEGATSIAEQRTLSSITNLADSPEFNSGKPNSVDGDKLIGLIQNKNYENFWPFSSLSVLRESGFNKTEDKWIKCTKANYPQCDFFEIYNKNVKNERATGSYVAFCKKEVENNQIYDKCEIAKLIAGTEILGGKE